MNQEKFGSFIKEIRKKNNLTQKQLADKYNVTYQAVSKWETGKNMPDTSLIKQMSKDFNISLEDMFEGQIKTSKKSNNKKIITITISLIIIILLTLIAFLLIRTNNSDFYFKTLSSTCDNFNISGNIAYNDKKSSIYITNIQYCGGNDTEKYNEIECILYESNNDIEKKISSYNYNKEENITLEDFLKTVTLSVDDYKKSCKEYSENSLYLSINAKDDNDKTTNYKIPLKLSQTCNN